MNDEEDDSSGEEEEEDELDPIAAERRRRSKADRLKGRAGEPQKPVVTEVLKLHAAFVSMLRQVLAE